MSFLTQNTNMLHSIIIDLIKDKRMMNQTQEIMTTFDAIIKNTNYSVLTKDNIDSYNKFVMIEIKKRMTDLEQQKRQEEPYRANDIREKRMQSLDEAFQQRQTELRNDLRVQVPEPVDFSDNKKRDDEPIDDILTRTLQQRQKSISSGPSINVSEIPQMTISETQSIPLKALPPIPEKEPEPEPVSEYVPPVPEVVMTGCFVSSMLDIDVNEEEKKTIITLKKEPWEKLVQSRDHISLDHIIILDDDFEDHLVTCSSSLYNHGIFVKHKQEYHSISLFDGYLMIERSAEPPKIEIPTILKNVILIFSQSAFYPPP